MAFSSRTRGIALAGVTSLALLAPTAPATAAAAPAPATITAAAAAAAVPAAGLSASAAPRTARATSAHAAAAAAAPTGARLRKRAFRIGKRLRGVPYRYGGTTPRGFDCSGFTQYVMRANGVRIPRTSSAQRARARWIPRSKARKGDLVFFHGSRGVYHVGIYAGHNRVLHAPRTGRRVSTERIWTSRVSFGRVA